MQTNTPNQDQNSSISTETNLNNPNISATDVTSIAATAPGQFRVIRRNGKVTAFDDEKISIAMTKAFLAVEGGNAAASLHTTATDYARFVVAIISGDGLDAGTHAAMLAPGSDLTGAGWGDDDEAKQHLFWGLGWGLQEGRHGPSFWHWGDQGTARCFVLAYPEDGDALVYFTNSANGLAIGPAILDLAFDDDHWSMRWLDYARYDDPVRLARLGLTRTFLDEGTEAGVEAFDQVRAEYPDLLDEGAVNNLGYVLLRRDAVDQAVWVFERNTLDYPESSNVWDSYGEGLRAAGRLEESIDMYEKAADMDPSNQNARQFIEEMEAELASG